MHRIFGRFWIRYKAGYSAGRISAKSVSVTSIFPDSNFELLIFLMYCRLLPNEEAESNHWSYMVQTFNIMVLCGEDYIVEPGSLRYQQMAGAHLGRGRDSGVATGWEGGTVAHPGRGGGNSGVATGWGTLGSLRPLGPLKMGGCLKRTYKTQLFSLVFYCYYNLKS